MSVVLLSGAVAETVGTPAPVGGLTGRVTATGTFGVVETLIEASPSGEQDDFISLGTLGTGETLLITQPWKRLRATAPATMTGAANVYFNPFPGAF